MVQFSAATLNLIFSQRLFRGLNPAWRLHRCGPCVPIQSSLNVTFEVGKELFMDMHQEARVKLSSHLVLGIGSYVFTGTINDKF